MNAAASIGFAERTGRMANVAPVSNTPNQQTWDDVDLLKLTRFFGYIVFGLHSASSPYLGAADAL